MIMLCQKERHMCFVAVWRYPVIGGMSRRRTHLIFQVVAAVIEIGNVGLLHIGWQRTRESLHVI
jgi:hypothetical protein